MSFRTGQEEKPGSKGPRLIPFVPSDREELWKKEEEEGTRGEVREREPVKINIFRGRTDDRFFHR